VAVTTVVKRLMLLLIVIEMGIAQRVSVWALAFPGLQLPVRGADPRTVPDNTALHKPEMLKQTSPLEDCLHGRPRWSLRIEQTARFPSASGPRLSCPLPTFMPGMATESRDDVNRPAEFDHARSAGSCCDSQAGGVL